MAAKKINLLPEVEFEESNLGRVLKWLLSSFRIIVIVLEGIVIAAFLSRFWLDAKNADLNQLIKQRESIILANSDFEKEFRLIQNKLRIYSSIASSKDLTEIINQVGSYLPSDVALSNITIDKDLITLRGHSTNEASINQFIVNLGGSEELKDSRLTQVGSDSLDASILNFTLTIKRKGQ